MARTHLYMDTDSLFIMQEQIIRLAHRIQYISYDLLIKEVKLRNLDIWEMVTATEFIALLGGTVRKTVQAAEDLQNLGIRLENEIYEWKQADDFWTRLHTYTDDADVTRIGHFTLASLATTLRMKEDDLKISGGRSKWLSPPNSMRELAEYCQDLPNDHPFMIIQTGENEYMVILRGIDIKNTLYPNKTNANELFGAAGCMLSRCEYADDVEQAIKAAVPEGAKISFAGHSHGGIVSEYLATKFEKAGSYDVENVITFGSPKRVFWAKGEFEFYRYDINGDMVSDIGLATTGRVQKSVNVHYYEIQDTLPTKVFDFTAKHGHYKYNELPGPPLKNKMWQVIAVGTSHYDS